MKIGPQSIHPIGKAIGGTSGQLLPFVLDNVSPGSFVMTDGWKGCNEIGPCGYNHRQIVSSKAANKESGLSGAHLVISLIKRLVLGTFQGRFERRYLQRFLDEYVFRFNRRTTQWSGKDSIVSPSKLYFLGRYL